MILAVASAISTSPAVASPCSRAARLGASPTKECFSTAASPTRSPATTIPVAIPIRTSSRSPLGVVSPPISFARISPVATARAASSSRAGIAEGREHAVADIAQHVTAIALDQGGADVLVACEQLQHDLGIEIGRKPGVADE